MLDNLKVEGGKQLAAALKDLPLRIAQRGLENALLQAGDVIRDEARRNFPGASGRAGIITQRAKARRSDSRTVKVRASRKRWYLKFIEFGRAAFKINAKNKRALATGGEIIGRSAEIPAMPARPFMRPALASKGAAAVKKMAEVLRRNVEQAARELAAGASKVRFKRR